jgi:hypothetical protein
MQKSLASPNSAWCFGWTYQKNYKRLKKRWFLLSTIRDFAWYQIHGKT